MTEKRTVSAKEAGEMLVKAGILTKETSFPEQAAKRLVKQGVLKGNPPRKEYPKEGYQIEEGSVKAYIELGKQKPSDLVKLVLQLKRELAIAKGEIDGDHEQTQIDEFIPNKPPKPTQNSTSSGRFVTTPWKRDGELPCPLCEEWYSSSNFKRHVEKNHNMTPEELFTQYREQADTMVNSR